MEPTLKISHSEGRIILSMEHVQIAEIADGELAPYIALSPDQAYQFAVKLAEIALEHGATETD